MPADGMCAASKMNSEKGRSARPKLAAQQKIYAISRPPSMGNASSLRVFREGSAATGRGKNQPRRAIILARRWHGRDGERAAEAAPSLGPKRQLYSTETAALPFVASTCSRHA
jgi:hypothetical protein